MLLSDYQLQVQELVHDLQAIDYTLSELTNYINAARKRVALDLHCVRGLLTNVTWITNQETYPINSGIVGLNVLTGGSGYTAATVVTIAAPGGSGTTATATPVIVGGVVTDIFMTSWGLGYSSAPNITITDSGGGTGATAAALDFVTNIFDILTLSTFQGTQRYSMNWSPFSPFQAFQRADPTRRGYPFWWSDFKEINKFFIYPIPDQPYHGEMDVLFLPTPLVNPNDIDLQVLDPPADAVQFYAAHLALLKMQNFGQAEYMHKKYKARATEITMTRQSRRYQNIYQSWARRTQRGY